MGKSIIEDPKGNQALGVQAKKEQKQQQNEVIVNAITGGFEPYNKLIQRLSEGEELTKAEKEYMDRIEKWVEYSIPKLARTENKTEISGKIEGFDVNIKK